MIHLHRDCSHKSQFGRGQNQNSLSSNLMIEMLQTNIAATAIEEFPVIKEVSTSNIFLGIIYIIILKQLAAMSTTV